MAAETDPGRYGGKSGQVPGSCRQKLPWPAELGGRAGAMGAVALALQRVNLLE